MTRFLYKAVFALTLLGININISAQDNIVDQIIWVVGDEAILKSDIEAIKMQMQLSGEKFDGDPDCIVPEQVAVQKLFLSQAKVDSIDVPVSDVSRRVEYLVANAISRYGSKEKLEEYSGKTAMQLREDWREQLRENAITDKVKSKIIGDVKLSPAEVRKYFAKISQDSLPMVPTTIEAQIITLEPKIPIEEIDNVKNKLREFTERINKKETTFSSMALLYSEDTESAKKGGELGFMSRSQLVPSFASAAFALTDPTKVSNVVESEYGYHIIQLIERKGDRANVRHILLKPRIPKEQTEKTTLRLDSIANDIKAAKFSFEEAAQFVSADKDTRNNKGLMVNKNQYSANSGTSRFAMDELPPAAARVIDKMNIGDISAPFTMITEKGKEVVAIVKLKQRTEKHKANLNDDYQALKGIVEEQKKDEILKKWVQEKIKDTYVRINEGWKGCDFQYSGWVK